MVKAEDFLPQDKKTDIRSMDPWQVIKEAANAAGIPIKNPKSNCKHCHGRGYVGRYADSGEPIACRCIFEQEKTDRDTTIDPQYIRPRNRAERRAMRGY
jgi:hypothetical protein